MNAVSWFEAVSSARIWLLPALAIAALFLPRPRRLGARFLIAIIIGWVAFFAFTVLIYNPAGIAAGHALGEHFPENRYDNNTTGIALVFGLIYPALAVGSYALARLAWLRTSRRGA